jgi:hypothetical protein
MSGVRLISALIYENLCPGLLSATQQRYPLQPVTSPHRPCSSPPVRAFTSPFVAKFRATAQIVPPGAACRISPMMGTLTADPAPDILGLFFTRVFDALCVFYHEWRCRLHLCGSGGKLPRLCETCAPAGPNAGRQVLRCRGQGRLVLLRSPFRPKKLSAEAGGEKQAGVSFPPSWIRW